MYTTHLIISRGICIIKHKFVFHFSRGTEISFSLNCSIVYRAVFIITVHSPFICTGIIHLLLTFGLVKLHLIPLHKQYNNTTSHNNSYGINISIQHNLQNRGVNRIWSDPFNHEMCVWYHKFNSSECSPLFSDPKINTSAVRKCSICRIKVQCGNT